MIGVHLDLPWNSIDDAVGATADGVGAGVGVGADGDVGGSTPEGRAINWESVDKRFVDEEKFPDGFLLIFSVTSPESFNLIPEMHG